MDQPQGNDTVSFPVINLTPSQWERERELILIQDKEKEKEKVDDGNNAGEGPPKPDK